MADAGAGIAIPGNTTITPQNAAQASLDAASAYVPDTLRIFREVARVPRASFVDTQIQPYGQSTWSPTGTNLMTFYIGAQSSARPADMRLVFTVNMTNATSAGPSTAFPLSSIQGVRSPGIQAAGWALNGSAQALFNRVQLLSPDGVIMEDILYANRLAVIIDDFTKDNSEKGNMLSGKQGYKSCEFVVGADNAWGGGWSFEMLGHVYADDSVNRLQADYLIVLIGGYNSPHCGDGFNILDSTATNKTYSLPLRLLGFGELTVLFPFFLLAGPLKLNLTLEQALVAYTYTYGKVSTSDTVTGGPTVGPEISITNAHMWVRWVDVGVDYQQGLRASLEQRGSAEFVTGGWDAQQQTFTCGSQMNPYFSISKTSLTGILTAFYWSGTMNLATIDTTSNQTKLTSSLFKVADRCNPFITQWQIVIANVFYPQVAPVATIANATFRKLSYSAYAETLEFTGRFFWGTAHAGVRSSISAMNYTIIPLDGYWTAGYLNPEATVNTASAIYQNIAPTSYANGAPQQKLHITNFSSGSPDTSTLAACTAGRAMFCIAYDLRAVGDTMPHTTSDGIDLRASQPIQFKFVASPTGIDSTLSVTQIVFSRFDLEYVILAGGLLRVRM